MAEKYIAWNEASLRGANLRGANLRGANMSEANLRGADLRGANMSEANLRGANLRGADLREANMSEANMSEADLRGADLIETNLRGADLLGANLLGANLLGADLLGANLSGAKNIPAINCAQTLACPEVGAFDGFKKCKNDVIVHVRIPAESRRSSATSRKCRAQFVDVIKVFGVEEGISQHDEKTVYRAGERVTCDRWNDDRWTECGGGIHFFITRAEAEAY